MLASKNLNLHPKAGKINLTRNEKPGHGRSHGVGFLDGRAWGMRK